MDFIKGGLDSHNGLCCERGHVAISGSHRRYCFLSFDDQKASETGLREIIHGEGREILFFARILNRNCSIVFWIIFKNDIMEL